MILRLTPDQIANLWDMIKYALEKSPPIAVDVKDYRWTNRILEAAMNGSIDVWVAYMHTDEGTRFEGVGITSFEVDRFVKQKSLLLYYAYAFRDTSFTSWQEGYEILNKYAKSRGCSRLMIYSNSDNIISLAKGFGCDVSVRFITLDIGGE